MSLVWCCDRCKKISIDGNVDDPPENWRTVTFPVRGSGGDWTGVESKTICGDCDESLYEWLWKANLGSEEQ